MTEYMMVPIKRYAIKQLTGPAVARADPAPMKRPVPTAPPMERNIKWRDEKPRSSSWVEASRTECFSGSEAASLLPAVTVSILSLPIFDSVGFDDRVRSDEERRL